MEKEVIGDEILVAKARAVMVSRGELDFLEEKDKSEDLGVFLVQPIYKLKKNLFKTSKNLIGYREVVTGKKIINVLYYYSIFEDASVFKFYKDSNSSAPNKDVYGGDLDWEVITTHSADVLLDQNVIDEYRQQSIEKVDQQLRELRMIALKKFKESLLERENINLGIRK